MPDSHDRLVLAAGATLFEEGEVGRAAYLIVEGAIEILLRRETGEVRLAIRGIGEIVGEMALLDAGPRSATARAASDCSVIPITEDQIRYRMDQLDPILRMFLGVVLARYRDLVPLLNASVPGAGTPERTEAAESKAAIARLMMERDLRRGLEAGEFELFFQPIVRLATGAVAGFEALMRWRHPERGLVQPAEFIAVAEASGLIVEITQRALSEVGRALPEIMAAALHNLAELEAPPFMSVNVSNHDLALAGFPATVADMLARTGLAPESLKIEITESILMHDPAKAAEALELCRKSGMGIAIDDFGTGYSSLSYLTSLPITTLKVDRAFVQAMTSEPRSRKVVQTILRLADELGIPVVAEGIEAEAEAEALIAMGCAYGQGYLFGRPTPLSETLALTRGWRRERRPAPPLRMAACP